MPELILFIVFAGIALVAALGVVLAHNPVHSALALVTVLIAVAGLFLIQEAQLVAAVQVIVYAGAIVVLFLFVIMLLGVDRAEPDVEPLRFQRPAALLIGLVSIAALLALGGSHWTTGGLSARGVVSPRGANNVSAVAESLFTSFLWPFELTAVLLMSAVIGGVVLARRSHLSADAELSDLEGQES